MKKIKDAFLTALVAFIVAYFAFQGFLTNFK